MSDLQGTLSANAGLDFEASPSYLFDVAVSDQPVDSTTSRSINCQVMVTLTDVNDNVPMFSEVLYERNVVENATEGTIVTQVTATDLDSGRNGEVRYRIQSIVGEYIHAALVLCLFTVYLHTLF